MSRRSERRGRLFSPGVRRESRYARRFSRMLWPWAEYSALGRDFTPSEALSPSASGIAKLEKQDGGKEGEAHAVGQDDDGIALQDAVNDPERDAGREDEEHFQRDVMGLAR